MIKAAIRIATILIPTLAYIVGIIIAAYKAIKYGGIKKALYSFVTKKPNSIDLYWMFCLVFTQAVIVGAVVILAIVLCFWAWGVI